MNHELFDRAKKEVPGCVRKVKPVAGDISEVEWIGPRSGAPPRDSRSHELQDGLGISADARQELVDKVSVGSTAAHPNLHHP